MKISQQHSNRRAHNWLIYDIGDRFLLKNAKYYKGVLYDLGAGESPFKDFFLKYAQQYVAVDWAGSYHDTQADIVADLNKPLPIESEVADTVVSLSVMEHLREPQMMLNEAYRILKPGGTIILQVPFMWKVHEAPYDFFRFTPYGLEFSFERANFVDIHIDAQAGFFTTLALKMNYFSLRFIRGPKPIRFILHGMLSICWYVGQMLAPYLDKVDRDWAQETSGFYVTARKP